MFNFMTKGLSKFYIIWILLFATSLFCFKTYNSFQKVQIEVDCNVQEDSLLYLYYSIESDWFPLENRLEQKVSKNKTKYIFSIPQNKAEKLKVDFYGSKVNSEIIINSVAVINKDGSRNDFNCSSKALIYVNNSEITDLNKGLKLKVTGDDPFIVFSEKIISNSFNLSSGIVLILLSLIISLFLTLLLFFLQNNASFKLTFYKIKQITQFEFFQGLLYMFFLTIFLSIYIDYLLRYSYYIYFIIGVFLFLYYRKFKFKIAKETFAPIFLIINIYLLSTYLSVGFAFFYVVLQISFYFLLKRKIYLAKFLFLSWIILCLQLFLSHSLYGTVGWDPELIWNAAINYKPQTIDGYFTVYPNNIMLGTILVVWVKILNLLAVHDLLFGAVTLNILFIDLAIILTYLVSKKSFTLPIQKTSLYLTLLLIGFSPWIVIYYTDTISMFIPLLIFYIYLFAKEKTGKTKLIYYFLLGIIVGFGYLFKPTSIIISIAILLFSVLSFEKKRILSYTKVLSILAISITLTFVSFSSIKKVLYGDVNEKEALTMTHFLMMGMQNYSFYGAYYYDDVMLSMTIKNENEREKKNIEVAKERLNNYGLVKYVNFLVKKSEWILQDGSFFWGKEGVFLRDYPSKNSFSIGLQNWVNQNYPKYAQIFWLLIISLIIISFFRKNKKDKETLFILRLTIFGLILFVLLFEGRSRYFLNHLPIFIILAADGFLLIKNKF